EGGASRRHAAGTDPRLQDRPARRRRFDDRPILRRGADRHHRIPLHGNDRARAPTAATRWMKSPLERAVRDVHAKLTEQQTEFCAREQCADDVVAMVMNQIRPRYTTTGLGYAVEAADLDTDQVRAQ